MKRGDNAPGNVRPVLRKGRPRTLPEAFSPRFVWEQSLQAVPALVCPSNDQKQEGLRCWATCACPGGQHVPVHEYSLLMRNTAPLALCYRMKRGDNASGNIRRLLHREGPGHCLKHYLHASFGSRAFKLRLHWFVRAMTKSRKETNPPAHLARTRRGSLSTLKPVRLDLEGGMAAAAQRHAGGIMAVAVHAVGLNFRDVLNVLGMYPGGQPLRLWGVCEACVCVCWGALVCFCGARSSGA